MRRRRLRVIFIILLVASTGATLFLPRPAGLQASASLFLAPISLPADRLAHWIAGPLGPDAPIDAHSPDTPRDVREVFDQNARLVQHVTWLEEQLAELRAVNQDRDRLGRPLRDISVPAEVVARDGQTLNVINRTGAALEPGMVALHTGQVHAGIAGRVRAVGAAAAQIQLVSDPELRVSGRFRRYDADSARVVDLATEPPLVEGDGGGGLLIARHKMDDLTDAGVSEGDWVVLSDSDPAWPDVVQGLRIGKVTRIEELADAPGFAQVRLEPAVDLAALGEVMIVIR